jgi:NTE family protein
VLGPGDTLGDRAFLNDEAHRVTAVVATHAVALRIPAAELEGVFTKNPQVAGRFSQAVTRKLRLHRERPSERGSRVRRVVSLLALAPRMDAPAVGHRLASALRQITRQHVLLLRLSPEGEATAWHEWSRRGPSLDGEFPFAKQVHPQDEGFDELRLPVGPQRDAAEAIAPLISECGRHYDYVLVQLEANLAENTILQAIIQADLAYVMLQPSMQCLYDFQLLSAALAAEARGAVSHVKPIVFAEESVGMQDFHDILKRLGLAVHSFAHGFPLSEAPTWPDRRFALHINRLAREIARCRVGLALSSGGAKGLAHVGAIQVLEEHGIEVDAIAGASMGAYVGSMWAYGLEGTALEKIAREHEGRWGIFSLLDPVLPPRQGFIRTRRVLKRFRRSLGDAHFSDLVRPLRVVATRLDTLERVVFASGEVALAVEASIAIPGICVPITIDGAPYVDGGVTDPLPVDVLEEMGIERIIAVNSIPTPEKIRYWRSHEAELKARQPARGSVGRWLNQRLNYFAPGNVFDTMVQAFVGAQMVVADASAHRADLVLTPVADDAWWYDFTHPAKYIALGRKAAEEQLPQLMALTQGIQNEPPRFSNPLALTAALRAA